jgi:hypothetical protein
MAISTSSSIVTPLVFASNTSLFVQTVDVPSNATNVTISFSAQLPRDLVVVCWLVPMNTSSLLASVPALAIPLIGSTSWLGVPATAFVDRYVLQPNTSSLPARWLGKCSSNPADATQVVCSLPTRMTLSFFLPKFDYVYANHFLLSSLGKRVIPLNFATLQGNPTLVNSELDKQNTVRVNVTLTGGKIDILAVKEAGSLNPLPGFAGFVADPLYLTGAFAPINAPLQFFLGYPIVLS